LKTTTSTVARDPPTAALPERREFTTAARMAAQTAELKVQPTAVPRANPAFTTAEQMVALTAVPTATAEPMAAPTGERTAERNSRSIRYLESQDSQLRSSPRGIGASPRCFERRRNVPKTTSEICCRSTRSMS
jgi:hypothetical protein